MRATEKYYTVGEAAFLLSFSKQWVRANLAVLPGSVVVKDGKKADYRIPASAINQFLAEHEVKTLDSALRFIGVCGRGPGEARRKDAARRRSTVANGVVE